MRCQIESCPNYISNEKGFFINDHTTKKSEHFPNKNFCRFHYMEYIYNDAGPSFEYKYNI